MTTCYTSLRYSVGLCLVLILNRDATKACFVKCKVMIKMKTFQVTKHPSFSSEVSSFRSGAVDQRSRPTSLVSSGQTLWTASFLPCADAASLVTSQPQHKAAGQHVH